MIVLSNFKNHLNNYLVLKNNTFKLGTFLIIFYFMLVTILIFSPAIYRPALFQVYGGDVYHNLWIWQRNFSNIMMHSPPYTPNIYYPDPLSSFYSEMEMGNSIIYGLLALLGVTPFKSYLIIIILSFALTGAMVAFIARLIGASTISGIISGTIAAFLGYRFQHLPHVQILSTYWMLLPFYFSFSYLINGKKINLLLSGIFHIPIFAGPSYNLMGLIFLEIAIVIGFIFNKYIYLSLRRKRCIFLLGVFFVSIIPTLTIWRKYFQLFSNGFSRNSAEFNAYHVDILSFLLPSSNNILYQYAWHFIKPTSINYINTLFVGFTAFFIFIGTFFFEKKNLDEFNKLIYYDNILKTVAISFIFFSLGPQLIFATHLISANPVFYIAEKIHFFSATRYITHYSYFGILILSIVSTRFISRVLNKYSLRARGIITGFLLLFIILENVPNYIGKLSELPKKIIPTPALYTYLKKLPIGNRIVFLPFMEATPANLKIFYRQFEYMFYIQNHLIMVNGISGFFPPQYSHAIHALENFPSMTGLDFILKNSIDYVIYDKRPGIIHANEFSESKIQSICTALTLFYADADYEVYKIDFSKGAICLKKATV